MIDMGLRTVAGICAPASWSQVGRHSQGGFAIDEDCRFTTEARLAKTEFIR